MTKQPDRRYGQRQHGERPRRERPSRDRPSRERVSEESASPERVSEDSVSREDATTKNLRRPALAPMADPPDYARRRAIVLATSAAVVLVVGVLVAATVRSGGDSPSEPTDAAVAVDSVEDADEDADEDVDAEDSSSVTTPDVTTAVEVDWPDHHGFNDEALYVALYGSISTDALGVLGESDPAGSVRRAATVAADYEGFDATVIPTFEIIASVASFAEGDGDYSNEASTGALQPWVDAADDAGYHVVLDLQSGRQRFPSQVTEFEPLLLEPHVSVALDPEWRVGPNSVPQGGKIGTVSGAEVNKTVEYLDRLVEDNDLPPKMLIVHQFVESMITEKASIRGTDNVQVVIHMDGFGSLELKRGSYGRATSDLPTGAVAGWKNFYDEDKPTPTAEQTMDNEPVPMFVSFQ